MRAATGQEDDMKRERIRLEQRRVPRLRWWEREEQVLPLDPRDPAIVRAKQLQRGEQ
jgi:hypothetical protein